MAGPRSLYRPPRRSRSSQAREKTAIANGADTSDPTAQNSTNIGSHPVRWAGARERLRKNFAAKYRPPIAFRPSCPQQKVGFTRKGIDQPPPPAIIFRSPKQGDVQILCASDDGGDHEKRDEAAGGANDARCRNRRECGCHF